MNSNKVSFLIWLFTGCIEGKIGFIESTRLLIMSNNCVVRFMLYASVSSNFLLFDNQIELNRVFWFVKICDSENSANDPSRK